MTLILYSGRLLPDADFDRIQEGDFPSPVPFVGLWQKLVQRPLMQFSGSQTLNAASGSAGAAVLSPGH
jgi:hypothetical protein